MNFKIEYAVDPGGWLVGPGHAIAGVTYTCPGCGAKLLHTNRGPGPKSKAPHFRHFRNDPLAVGCKPETVEHATAKKLIELVSRNWIAGNSRPRISSRRCNDRLNSLIDQVFEAWTEVLGSERLTGALLDRLTHRVHIIEANGDSYRLRDSQQRLKRKKSVKKDPVKKA